MCKRGDGDGKYLAIEVDDALKMSEQRGGRGTALANGRGGQRAYGRWIEGIECHRAPNPLAEHNHQQEEEIANGWVHG